MIRVNYRDMAWEEGLTVQKLLQKMREEKPYQLMLRGKVNVIVNNEIIPPSDYAGKEIQDGDEIRVYPFLAGG